MASTLLTPSIIAKEGLMQLDNNLVAAKLAYRAYESEFGETKIGDTVTIRKPVKYTSRTGAVISAQDATEGKTTITIDKQRGVDLRFPSKDLTLTIDRFAERYLKHPMIELANKVDLDITGLYKYAWNWVGTPGYALTGYKSASKAAERLDNMAVPSPRVGLLSPGDFYGMAGSFTGLYVQDVARDALTKSKLPAVGNVDYYAAQNVINHTVGDYAGSPVVSSTSMAAGTGLAGSPALSMTWANAKDTNVQHMYCTGMTASKTLNPGDVFTIAGVHAVNPVSKQPIVEAGSIVLQQFVVQSLFTGNGATDVDLVFSPAIITSGPYQNVDAAPVATAVITPVGTAKTTYPQNLVFNQDAFALCMVPMELPEGAVKKARQSYKGLSVRVICDYDIINDINMWRLDILYGVKPIYPDLATRLSGASS
jgi:hypothetical protein